MVHKQNLFNTFTEVVRIQPASGCSLLNGFIIALHFDSYLLVPVTTVPFITAKNLQMLHIHTTFGVFCLYLQTIPSSPTSLII